MNSYTQKWRNTAQELVMAKGKGILAIDKSDGTCNRRFDNFGIPTTEENLHAY